MQCWISDDGGVTVDDDNVMTTHLLVIGVDKIWVTITPNKCWHMEGKIVWSMFFDFIPNCTVIDDVTYK